MHKLTIEELREQYRKADKDGLEWLKIVNSEKEYTLNAIATINMNRCTEIKLFIQNRIGRLMTEDKVTKK